MAIIRNMISFLGFGFNTYVHRLDISNTYRKFRVKENGQFLTFKLQGTRHYILKTVPAKVNNKGDKHYFIMEGDLHTFSMDDGSVLAPEMEREFKTRLMKDGLMKFEKMLEEAQSEQIKERMGDILDSMLDQDVIEQVEEEENGKEKTKEEKNDQKEEKKKKSELSILNINAPVIKLGKTLEAKIQALTPHDTIEEVFGLILEGSLLKTLLTPPKLSKLSILGIGIVGVCVGLMSVIGYAVLFPEDWAKLVGSTVYVPVNNGFVNIGLWLKGMLLS